MNAKLNKKLLSLSLALLTVGMLTVTEAASKEPGLLADGELFTSERVANTGKVLYDGKIDAAQWIWHNNSGYPKGTGLAAFVYGDGLPAVPGKGPSVNGVPKPEQMIAVAKHKYGIAENKNSLMLYVTTGPSAAKTGIAISKVELYGRLLNVVVAMRDAEPNTPLTMNLIYPEANVKIPLSKLPTYGNLRVRFVDVQGHALKNEDVLLGR